MKPWHYINIERGETYKASTAERNIVLILNSAINELRHKDSLKFKNIQEDLYILFHLVGDLHQPLHVGYGVDKGGNDIDVSFIYKTYHTNLHKVWDFEIIESKNITLADILKQYDSLSTEQIKSVEHINVLQWMNESRAYLPAVYDFEKRFITQEYVDVNTVVIEKQILFAGMRLAAVLRETFGK